MCYAFRKYLPYHFEHEPCGKGTQPLRLMFKIMRYDSQDISQDTQCHPRVTDNEADHPRAVTANDIIATTPVAQATSRSPVL
jgi:hypothetical protein